MTTRYARGRAFEYRVRDFLQRQGALVVRAAGSRGIADLVAIWGHPHGPEVWLVQVKRNGRLSPAERSLLVQSAEVYSCKPVVARPRREGRRSLVQLDVL